MLLALFQGFCCFIPTSNSSVKFCISPTLTLKYCLLCVFSITMWYEEDLDGTIIFVESHEQILCKYNSGPSYLIPTTNCRTHFLDLS